MQQNKRLACWVENDQTTDVASAYRAYGASIVCSRGVTYVYLFGLADNLENFVKECSKQNIAFYLPVEAIAC